MAVPNKRSLQGGCHDADGVHHAVGEGWKVDSGYCKCYERGNIWCVGEPVTAPPRRLFNPLFSASCRLPQLHKARCVSNNP